MRPSNPRGETTEGRMCLACREVIKSHASRCSHCGEWAVETSLTFAARILRVLGWTLVAGTFLFSFALWALLRGTDAYPSPLGSELGMVIGIAVLFQGALWGLAAVVLAELSPRKPAR